MKTFEINKTYQANYGKDNSLAGSVTILSIEKNIVSFEFNGQTISEKLRNGNAKDFKWFKFTHNSKKIVVLSF